MITPEQLRNFYVYFKVMVSNKNTSVMPQLLNNGNIFYSKPFVIADDIINYLSPEYTKNTIYVRKLPFDRMFLLNTFKLCGEVIRGMLIVKAIHPDGNESISLYCVVERIVSTDYEKGIAHTTCQIYQSDMISDSIQKTNIDTIEEELKWNNHDYKIQKGMRLFACNFLDFMNNPEISITEISRTDEQKAKRIKRKKLPIPSYSYVKITGKLKIYFDSLKSEKHDKFSHKFWVRGHFRTLRSEIWKKKQGMKIWIPPYIKGEGVLINKHYEVKQNAQHS